MNLTSGVFQRKDQTIRAKHQDGGDVDRNLRRVGDPRARMTLALHGVHRGDWGSARGL